MRPQKLTEGVPDWIDPIKWIWGAEHPAGAVCLVFSAFLGGNSWRFFWQLESCRLIETGDTSCLWVALKTATIYAGVPIISAHFFSSMLPWRDSFHGCSEPLVVYTVAMRLSKLSLVGVIVVFLLRSRTARISAEFLAHGLYTCMLCPAFVMNHLLITIFRQRRLPCVLLSVMVIPVCALLGCVFLFTIGNIPTYVLLLVDSVTGDAEQATVLHRLLLLALLPMAVVHSCDQRWAFHGWRLSHSFCCG